MANSPSVNFRVPVEDLRKLDHLVEVTGSGTRSSLLLSWIRAEYDRLEGSPELKQIVEHARELQTMLQSLSGL